MDDSDLGPGNDAVLVAYAYRQNQDIKGNTFTDIPSTDTVLKQLQSNIPQVLEQVGARIAVSMLPSMCLEHPSFYRNSPGSLQMVDKSQREKAREGEGGMERERGGERDREEERSQNCLECMNYWSPKQNLVFVIAIIKLINFIVILNVIVIEVYFLIS